MPRYESPYDPSTMPKKLDHVIYEKKGHVAYVTINRPEVRNALHSYAYAELRSYWRLFPGDGPPQSLEGGVPAAR
jgi:1,4-dihydroxy-2-naphthoyl-CoA synthase